MLSDEELEELRPIVRTFKVLDYTKEDIKTVLKVNETILMQVCKYYDIL